MPARREPEDEAALTQPDPTDITNPEAVGHQTAMNARGAAQENQNLYNDTLGPNYLEAAGEAEGAYAPPPTAKGDPYRDPAIIGVTHVFHVPLSRTVLSVRTGTPIKPGLDGWVIASSGDAQAMAHSYAEGGTRVPACKLATLETYERQFRSGEQVGVEYVDDRGAIVWSKTGPFLALNDTQVLVDLTRAGA